MYKVPLHNELDSVSVFITFVSAFHKIHKLLKLAETAIRKCSTK